MPIRNAPALRSRHAHMDAMRKGTTIIEMTLILAIMSVLAAIALPRASGFIDRIEVRGSVTELKALFSLARHIAIARGSQSTLVIDAAGATVTLRVGSEIVQSRSIGAAHGVAIQSNRGSITYSPIGVGYGAANFTLIVARNAAADTLIISRLGRVRN